LLRGTEVSVRKPALKIAPPELAAELPVNSPDAAVVVLET
jgi:hypothetical protein